MLLGRGCLKHRFYMISLDFSNDPMGYYYNWCQLTVPFLCQTILGQSILSGFCARKKQDYAKQFSCTLQEVLAAGSRLQIDFLSSFLKIFLFFFFKILCIPLIERAEAGGAGKGETVSLLSRESIAGCGAQ